MGTNKGNSTGGALAISGKVFSCKIGDSIEQIEKANTHLSADDVQQVFEITRVQQDEDYDPTAED